MKYLPLQIVLALTLASAAHAADPLTYERDIRPILKAACFHCHGEEPELQGSLDLRLKRFIVKGGDTGAAIVPGDPAASLLMDRITSGEMPPGDVALTEDEIDRIRNWIAAGAPTARPEPEDVSPDGFTYEERNFWSLQPVVQSAVPQPKDGSRVRTPVDAFVLARLEQDGLTFSPDADRATLIRRLSFDLLGLPPTPEEVASFVADTSPDAYEKVVDRLLASPHYGERWGRHWLDVAGYADSEGMTEEDRPRPSAFRYRDYVIRSFNDDRPFDQFIVEQLAGDELVTGPHNNMSPETIEKLTATGFLRMAPDGTATGGIDQDVARNQVISETVKIVSTALMGLTVGCAECHDHRYDPIRQKDYYALRAIFEPALNWKKWRTPPARQISLYTDADRALAAEIEARAKEADAKRLEVANEFVAQTLDTQLQKLEIEDSVRDALRNAYQTAAKERTGEQNELLDKYPKIKQISIGSLYLYDREIRTDAAKLESERKKKEAEYVARAAENAIAAVPADSQSAVKAAVAVAAGKRTDEQKALLQQNPGVLVTVATLEQFDPEGAAELAQQKQAIADLLASQKANRLEEMQKEVDAIRAEKPVEGFMRALTEVPGQIPDTFLFFRGELNQPKDKVPAAGLSVLADRDLVPIPQDDPSLPTTGRRLAFARRLTDGRHPLTARVLVNRFWLHYFGNGIVATPGDFGFLGVRPTHPELLDWLAADFMNGGWRLKRFHKLITMSTTYRQSSVHNPRSDEVDPDNHLYSRMSVRRLDAESIRDAVLAISGKLNANVLGEPVPVMEDIVGQIVIGKENLDGERKPLAAIDLNGEEYRRSMYIQVRRSRPLGVLSTFDLPEMEPNCTLRNSSTGAPQALMLMNSDFAAEYAGYFAERVRKQSGEMPADQCRLAWELAFGRAPDHAELLQASEFLSEQATIYAEHPPADSKQTPSQLALASFCQALLSSNEFLYVD